MAKQAQRLPFSHRGPFVVSRRFSWNGKVFEPGSDFQHRHLCVDHRRLRLLWDAKKIDMKGLPEEPEEIMLVGSNVQPAEVMMNGELKLLGEAVEAAFLKSGLSEADWNGLPEEDREARIAEVIDLVPGEGEFIFDPAVHVIEREGKEYWIADDEHLLIRVKAKTGKELDVVTEKTLVTADSILARAEEEDASEKVDDTEESE